MKRLLVILHVYYHDQIDYFIDKMKNINGVEWDLTVTYSQENEVTKKKLLNFKKDIAFMNVGNSGYDVWPFIQVIQKIEVEKYDYILKLHTKNTSCMAGKLNGMQLKGHRWRDMLINSLLRSPEQFSRCLRLFGDDPKLGLICSYELYIGLSDIHKEDMESLNIEADRIGVEIKQRKFCAGTMFMIRSQCLKKIIKAHFTSGMWECCGSHSGGTLAHVYERILSMTVEDAGYYVRSLSAYPLNKPIVFTHRHINPVLKSILTIDRHGEDRKKYLTILGKRFSLEK